MKDRNEGGRVMGLLGNIVSFGTISAAAGDR
jgi:hypothetical protein